MLHVGADVRVGGAERRLARPGRRVRRETDQGDVGDDRTAPESWRSAGREEEERHIQEAETREMQDLESLI